MQSKDSFYRILQPIYPLLAQQLVDDYGLDKGICIDLGSGPGHVGIEIAKITYMDIYFVDDNEDDLKRELNSNEETKAPEVIDDYEIPNNFENFWD